VFAACSGDGVGAGSFLTVPQHSFSHPVLNMTIAVASNAKEYFIIM
jgi:hypothetical protein